MSNNRIIHMKKILFFLILISASWNCSSQSTIDSKYSDMTIPTIYPNFEKFNFDHYQNLVENSNKNSKFVYEILSDSSMMIYKVDEDNIPSSSQYLRHPFYSFAICKQYYPNGNIKEKGIMFDIEWGTKTQIGNWYLFDDSGKLKETINYDKDYKVTIKDVLQFCSKKKIPYEKNSANPENHFDIKKIDGKWEIIYSDSITKGLKCFIMDGKTGKVVDKGYMIN